MSLSDSSSDNDENGDDNLEGILVDNNAGETDGEDDVDEDILEALEDAIAEEATDEESTYDSEDGSGEDEDAESERLSALLGEQLGLPPPDINLPPNEFAPPPSSEPQDSPGDVCTPPSVKRSPSPENVPAPKARSPSPAFIRKTKLLSNFFVPRTYTVEAVCALPHPGHIHSLASSLCMTHMLTGSEDGYIRDYDVFAGVNGKNFLTAPQRMHCQVVEGLLKYAPLKFWWENPSDIKREELSEERSLSPVHSLLMHSDALWTLAGTHLGHINLFTVRHEPGRLCHVMHGHRGPVSAMSMQHDEQGFFSAGWDGSAIHWDLNSGQIIRNFVAHGSQLTAIAVQPFVPVAPATTVPPAREAKPTAAPNDDMDAKSDGSYDPLFDDEPDTDAARQTPASQKQSTSKSDLSLPGTGPNASRVPSSSVPRNAPPVLEPNLYATFSPDILMTASIDGQIVLWDRRAHTPGTGVGRMFMDDKTPPWCASACWSANGTQIYAGRRNGTIDIWDVRQFGSRDTPRHLKVLHCPQNSGVVSCVVAFPDSRHIVSASNDNVRLWNVAEAGESDVRKSKGSAQFKIITGHHGGFISQMLIDPAGRFLITASGNRGWHGESSRTVFIHDVKHVR